MRRETIASKLTFTAEMAKDGRKIKIMASSQEELDKDIATYAAQGFVEV